MALAEYLLDKEKVQSGLSIKTLNGTLNLLATDERVIRYEETKVGKSESEEFSDLSYDAITSVNAQVGKKTITYLWLFYIGAPLIFFGSIAYLVNFSSWAAVLLTSGIILVILSFVLKKEQWGARLFLLGEGIPKFRKLSVGKLEVNKWELDLGVLSEKPNELYKFVKVVRSNIQKHQKK